MLPTTAVHRLREVLDLYSSRLAHRLVVVACIAAGVGLAVVGASSGSSVLAAIPLGALVWANGARFLASVDEVLSRHAWLVAAVPLAVLASKLVVAPPTASDDLLRHIAVAFWPDGYAGMYVETSLPPVTLYPLFERVAGALARTVGTVEAMWTLQACALGGFVAVFLAAAHRELAGHPMKHVLALAALVLVLAVMSGRIFLARPEFFMTIWTLAALLAGSASGIVAWSLAGFALSSAYWLAPIYFPAVVLLRGSWRVRAVVLCMLVAWWALFWSVFSDGRLVETMHWMFGEIGKLLPGLYIRENAGIAGVLLLPQMLVLLVAAGWAARRPGARHGVLLLAVYFMLSNRARYASIAAPLLALHALPALGRVPVPWPPHSRIFAVALAAIAMSLIAGGVPKLADLPRFDLPQGAIVLTGFDQATFATPFANPGTVRAAPGFELGAASPDVQRMVANLTRGVIRCDDLRSGVFTHVVEDRLRGDPPPCLSLVSVQGPWRLWAVNR